MNITDLLAAAERLGLAYNGGTELIGRRDDVLVRIGLVSPTRADRCGVEIPARGFDRRLGLRDVPVLRGLARRAISLDQGWLWCEEPAPVDDIVEELAAAARRVAGWWRAPAEEITQRLPLTASEDLSRFEGVVDGCPVWLAEDARAATIRAGVARPGLHVGRPGAGAPPTALRDVVLDGRISARGCDPERLCTDEIRGPLLAVLYDHDGAVEDGVVRATVATLRDVGEVRRAVRDAVDLARALEAALRPRAEGQGPAT